MHRRLLPLLLVLVAVLAGCGEDDASVVYLERVDAAQRTFADRVQRIGAGVTATSSPQQDRRTLERFERALDDVVAELGAIAPPGEVRGLHGRLVGALAAYERDVASVVRAIDGDSPSRLRAAQRELQRATADVDGEIDRTTAAINDALRG
jgi:hypothetical protein